MSSLPGWPKVAFNISRNFVIKTVRKRIEERFPLSEIIFYICTFFSSFSSCSCSFSSCLSLSLSLSLSILPSLPLSPYPLTTFLPFLSLPISPIYFPFSFTRPSSLSLSLSPSLPFSIPLHLYLVLSRYHSFSLPFSPPLFLSPSSSLSRCLSFSNYHYLHCSLSIYLPFLSLPTTPTVYPLSVSFDICLPLSFSFNLSPSFYIYIPISPLIHLYILLCLICHKTKPNQSRRLTPCYSRRVFIRSRTDWKVASVSIITR